MRRLDSDGVLDTDLTTGHPAAQRARERDRKALLVAVSGVVGVAGGVLSFLGENLIDSRWAMITFAVGVVVRDRWRLAVLAGAATQIGLVLGYYGIKPVVGWSLSWTSVLTYSAVEVVAGPLYGATGVLVRDRRRRLRVCALGLVGAAWITDGARTVLADTAGPGARLPTSRETRAVLC